MPLIKFNSVDFPAPFGPITANTMPGAIANEMLRTARTPPKFLHRPLARNRTMFSPAILASAAAVTTAPQTLRQPQRQGAPGDGWLEQGRRAETARLVPPPH